MAWISDAIEGGSDLNFCIQASNPRFQCVANPNDKCLSEAIENAFPLSTENAILTWNYVSIPLSYKYDISYMIDDVLKLIYAIQNYNYGQMVIHWLPDTFRCDWSIKWDNDKVQICSKWGNTIGHLEGILNENNYISLLITEFINEWKEVLGVVIKGLKYCGYDELTINGMSELIKQYEKIKESGILYKK